MRGAIRAIGLGRLPASAGPLTVDFFRPATCVLDRHQLEFDSARYQLARCATRVDAAHTFGDPMSTPRNRRSATDALMSEYALATLSPAGGWRCSSGLIANSPVETSATAACTERACSAEMRFQRRESQSSHNTGVGDNNCTFERTTLWRCCSAACWARSSWLAGCGYDVERRGFHLSPYSAEMMRGLSDRLPVAKRPAWWIRRAELRAARRRPQWCLARARLDRRRLAGRRGPGGGPSLGGCACRRRPSRGAAAAHGRSGGGAASVSRDATTGVRDSRPMMLVMADLEGDPRPVEKLDVRGQAVANVDFDTRWPVDELRRVVIDRGQLPRSKRSSRCARASVGAPRMSGTNHSRQPRRGRGKACCDRSDRTASTD